MTDESGSFDVRKLRKEGIRVPGWMLTSLITLMGGIGTYGVVSGQQSARMTEYERRDQERATDLRSAEIKLATHDTELAVYRERLDTILVELGQIKAQLQRAENERGAK